MELQVSIFHIAVFCPNLVGAVHFPVTFWYMVVDLKVLDSIVYDDDPEHIKISFGESFFSSWRKYIYIYNFFFPKDLAKD